MSRVRRHERSSSVPESQQRFLTGVSKSYPTSKLFYAAWPFPERRISSFANQAATRVHLRPDGSEGVERACTVLWVLAGDTVLPASPCSKCKPRKRHFRAPDPLTLTTAQHFRAPDPEN